MTLDRGPISAAPLHESAPPLRRAAPADRRFLRRTVLGCVGLCALAGALWVRESGVLERWARRRVGRPPELPFGIDESTMGRWLTVHAPLLVDRHTVRGIDCCSTYGFREVEDPPLELPPDHPALRSLAAVPVEVIVASTGEVAEARILRPPHTPSIERALVAALARWRFEPSRLKQTDQPVPHYAWVSVRLRPQQGPTPPPRPGS